MDRGSLVAAAGTGSLSGLLLQLLAKALENPPPEFPSCPHFDLPELEFQGIDLRSFLLGLLVGVCAGPVIELLYAAKLLWRRTATRWCLSLQRQPVTLYKVHEQ